ncbi:MAG TPA: hypothetical protein VFS19_01850, partial [Planctomycetota bacterium]|nr:hypothetical protein [Planctomycetota bacterium]
MIELLRTKFVAAAVDCWYLDRAKDAAGEFYKKVVSQRQPFEPGVRSTQGFYAFAPDGTLLRGWNNRNVPRMREYLERALKDFKPGTADALDAARDPRFQRSLPEGAVVVDVYSKILEADWPPTDDEMIKPLRVSTGRDHLWILKDEIDALAAGRFPERLAKRIARYHLIDNTRGEPPMWAPAEVKELALGMKGGRVKLESGDGDRSFVAGMAATVEFRDGILTRFELVARGKFAGEGRFTKNAPPGS